MVTEAVVLLLDGGDELQPLTRCSALLPFGQQPLIEFTLGWLECNGLNEVHLVTCSHADQLTAYLRQAGWAGGAQRGMAVHVIAAPGCLSEGEALRFVEQKDVIKGDFVLVSGSLVCNLDLRPALQAHLTRRGADRHALMTLLLHTGSSSSSADGQADVWLAAVDGHNQQLLRLERAAWPNGQAGHGASLGTHMFSERNSIQARTDLRQCNIYICAPDVLILLSDNFDYQNIADDLVSGVLSEQDLGSTLYIHELSKGYVERVGTLADYLEILEDVVSRWVYPWVPDASGHQHDLCRFNRGTYVDALATVATGCIVSKGSLIGRGSTVAVGSLLDRCIVGRNCHIGRGVKLQGSCLHANVWVDDNCKVSSALLAEHVVIRSHVKVETAALLAKQTVVDAAHCVPAGAQVSLIQHRRAGAGAEDEMAWVVPDADSTATLEAAAIALAAGGIPEIAMGFDEAVVGPFGAGFVWLGRGFGVPERSLLPITHKLVISDCDSEAGDFTKDGRTVEGLNDDAQANITDRFKFEVAETFLRCIKESISHENAVIELNGLKIAEDRTFADCARYIFTTMLSLCLPPAPSIKSEYHGLFPNMQRDLGSKEARLDLLRRINALLKTWSELLQRFLKSSDDQVELLLTFEEFCAEEGEFSFGEHGSLVAELFPQVVKLCYDYDLLAEESILKWALEKENAANEDRRFIDMCSDFLAWLHNAEEESSDGTDT